VGKSTFVKLLAGLQTPTSGTQFTCFTSTKVQILTPQAPTSGAVRVGETVVVGHYASYADVCWRMLRMLTSGAVRVGETVVVGHYEQQGLDLPVDMTILDFVIDSGALGDGGKCVYIYTHTHIHTHILSSIQARLETEASIFFCYFLSFLSLFLVRRTWRRRQVYIYTQIHTHTYTHKYIPAAECDVWRRDATSWRTGDEYTSSRCYEYIKRQLLIP
jgi:energy-coupling factor transporter ATP-binding protein EcfA2